MVTIGRTTILVRDLDEARDFYRWSFGFRTLFDGEFAPGMRTVHVGPEGERDPGLWLFLPTNDAERARIGSQTGGAPTLVMYVDALEQLLARLESSNVGVAKPLTVQGDAKFAHVFDPSGNEIVLAELPSAERRDDAYRLVES
jgi:catechol 2,3-dioxygenase-like lactoylglutathione lyase family enzyme